LTENGDYKVNWDSETVEFPATLLWWNVADFFGEATISLLWELSNEDSRDPGKP
jgi:hypothetical protein